MIETITAQTPRPVLTAEQIRRYKSIQAQVKKENREDYQNCSPQSIPGFQSIGLANILNVIRTAVETATGIDRYTYGMKTRKREYAYCRHMERYFLRQYTTLSLKSIGQRSSGADHSSIINSIKAWADLLETDKDIRKQHETAEAIIKKSLTTETAGI